MTAHDPAADDAAVDDVAADDPALEDMRLDDLAAAAGVATTTIRLYQQRGLLPGPRLVGRTGWYSRGHLERLRLIARLQGDGFSLAGIGRLLEAAERGGDLHDLVGVQTELDAARHRAEPLVIGPADLLVRFGAGAVGPAEMARAVELGLVEGTDDGRLRVPDRRFLEVGAALVALGVPTSRVLDEWEHLRGVADEIAGRFVAVLETDVLGTDWRRDLDPEITARAAEALPRLMQLAHQVVDAALDAAIAAQIDRHLGRDETAPTGSDGDEGDRR